MKFALKAFIILCLVSFWVWGIIVEPYLILDYDNVEIPISKWDKNLDGLKVALVSDIHAGAGPAENWRIRRIVEKTNAAKPDIIFLLGDYVNGGIYYGKMDMERLSAYLKNLKAPYGVYAILGNHDSYYDTASIRKMLSEAGIHLLENSNAKVSTPRGDFYVAGIADPITQNYFYRPSFANIPKGKPVIFLSHSPDVFREIPPAASVMFSGHTHGGQVRMPFWGSVAKNVKFEKKAVEGLYRKDGKTAYVTRGLGTSRIPVRFMCTPTITLATIRKSYESDSATPQTRNLKNKLSDDNK